MSWGILVWVIVAGLVIVVLRVAFLQHRLMYLSRIYPRWLAAATGTPDKPYMTSEQVPYLRRVLIEARVGIEDISFPHVDLVGYGYLSTSSYKLIDNLLVRDAKMVMTTDQKFAEARGAYRMRRNDTINPIRWVITLWTLPKAIAKSIGANQDAWPVRLVQVVYQLAVVVTIGLQLWDKLRQ